MTNLKRLSLLFPPVLLAATGLLAACGKDSKAKEPGEAMEKAGEQAEQAGEATDKAAGEAAEKLDEAGDK